MLYEVVGLPGAGKSYLLSRKCLKAPRANYLALSKFIYFSFWLVLSFSYFNIVRKLKHRRIDAIRIWGRIPVRIFFNRSENLFDAGCINVYITTLALFEFQDEIIFYNKFPKFPRFYQNWVSVIHLKTPPQTSLCQAKQRARGVPKRIILSITDPGSLERFFGHLQKKIDNFLVESNLQSFVIEGILNDQYFISK